MKIIIANREDIEKLALKPFPAKTAVISITDSDALPVNFHCKPEFLLTLVFDDMEPESDPLDKLLRGYAGFKNECRIITDEQAQQIASFAKCVHESANLLVCQCEFGQSRSTAIAAAITEYFHGNGINIFADSRYCPNKHVFRIVMNALRKA